MKHSKLSIIMSAALLVMLMHIPVAFASEVTGTLSNNPSQTVINTTAQSYDGSPHQTALGQSAGSFDIALMVKVLLVALLIIEISILVFLNVRSKRRLSHAQKS
jgi:hypothetical protein